MIRNDDLRRLIRGQLRDFLRHDLEASLFVHLRVKGEVCRKLSGVRYLNYLLFERIYNDVPEVANQSGNHYFFKDLETLLVGRTHNRVVHKVGVLLRLVKFIYVPEDHFTEHFPVDLSLNFI